MYKHCQCSPRPLVINFKEWVKKHHNVEDLDRVSDSFYKELWKQYFHAFSWLS